MTSLYRRRRRGRINNSGSKPSVVGSVACEFNPFTSAVYAARRRGADRYFCPPFRVWQKESPRPRYQRPAVII